MEPGHLCTYGKEVAQLPEPGQREVALRGRDGPPCNSHAGLSLHADLAPDAGRGRSALQAAGRFPIQDWALHMAQLDAGAAFRGHLGAGGDVQQAIPLRAALQCGTCMCCRSSAESTSLQSLVLIPNSVWKAECTSINVMATGVKPFLTTLSKRRTVYART